MFTTGLKEIVLNSSEAYTALFDDSTKILDISGYVGFDVTKTIKWSAERFVAPVGDVIGLTFKSASDLGIYDKDNGETDTRSVTVRINVGTRRFEASSARNSVNFGNGTTFSLAVSSEDTAADVRLKFIEAYRSRIAESTPPFDMYKQGTDDLILYATGEEAIFQDIDNAYSPLLFTIEGENGVGNYNIVPDQATIGTVADFGSIGRYTGEYLEQNTMMGTKYNTNPYKVGANRSPDVSGKYLRIYFNIPGSSTAYKAHPNLGPDGSINNISTPTKGDYSIYILEDSSAVGVGEITSVILDALSGNASAVGQMVKADGSVATDTADFLGDPVDVKFDPSVLGDPALNGFIIL